MPLTTPHNMLSPAGAPHHPPTAPCPPSPVGAGPKVPGLQGQGLRSTAPWSPQQCLSPGSCPWEVAVAVERSLAPLLHGWHGQTGLQGGGGADCLLRARAGWAGSALPWQHGGFSGKEFLRLAPLCSAALDPAHCAAEAVGGEQQGGSLSLQWATCTHPVHISGGHVAPWLPGIHAVVGSQPPSPLTGPTAPPHSLRGPCIHAFWPQSPDPMHCLGWAAPSAVANSLPPNLPTGPSVPLPLPPWPYLW